MLMANGDQVAGHPLTIDQALQHGNCEAFLPIKKRDLYNLDPRALSLESYIQFPRVSSSRNAALSPWTWSPSWETQLMLTPRKG